MECADGPNQPFARAPPPPGGDITRVANARRRAIVVVMGAVSEVQAKTGTPERRRLRIDSIGLVAATLRAPCHVRRTIISNRLAPRFPIAAAAAAPGVLLLGSISSL